MWGLLKPETRVRRFLDRLTGRRPADWRCPTCGQAHENLPAATSKAPLVWEIASDAERAADFELTSDFCVWKLEHFFIRACLEIPCTDRDGEVLNFGVWTSLSRESFQRYHEAFETQPATAPPTMFGWLSNSLPGYPETLNLKCNVHPRTDGLRPLIELQACDHPLYLQQRDGLTFAEIAAYLHEHLDL